MKSISNEIQNASESEFRHGRVLPLPSCHVRLKQHSGARGSVQNDGVEAVPKQTRAEKNCQGQTEEIIVQRMSSEVTGKQQKYTRIGPRELVPFEFDEIILTT